MKPKKKTTPAKKASKTLPDIRIKDTKPKTIRLPKVQAYWKANDNRAIAREHGIHPNTAARFRFSHNLPHPVKYAHRVFRQPRVDYSKIDLGLTAAENASKTGLKQSWVAQIMTRLRKQQGLPPGQKGVRKATGAELIMKSTRAAVKRNAPKGKPAPKAEDDSWA